MMTRAMAKVCLGLAFLLAGGACQKVGSEETEKAVAPPATLLAMIELPSPENLGSLPAFADRFQPGVGAMMGGPLMSSAIAQIFEGTSLVGADMDKPALLLINGVDGPESMVLVVGVKDAGKLRESLSGSHVDVRGKYAAIGKEKTVKELADYGIFRAQTLTVKDVGGTVYPRPLLDASGKVFEGFKATMLLQSNNGPAMQAVIDVYAKFFSALGKQTQEVNFRLYAKGGTATLDFVVVPHPGTPLAAMIALQKPSDFALLGRLRSDAKPMLVMAGSMVLGPVRKPLLEGMRPMMAAMYSEELVATWWSLMDRMMDMFTGDMAMLMSMGGGMQMSGAMGMIKGSEFRTLALPFFKELGKKGEISLFDKGPKQTIVFTPSVFSHSGVQVDQQVTTTDYSSMAPEVANALQQQGMMMPRLETHFAALDDVYVTEIGTSPTEATKAAIDTALGKKPGFQPSGALTTALDTARKRKDNVVMIFDLKDFLRTLPVPANTPLPGSFAMAVGFPDGQMRMSFSLSM